MESKRDSAKITDSGFKTSEILPACRGRVHVISAGLTARYKVRENVPIWLLYSWRTGASSDIDLLAEFEATADLFDLIGLELYLEERLQRPVDVVPKQALRVELRETVLHQVVNV